MPSTVPGAGPWPLLVDPKSLLPIRVDEVSDEPFRLTAADIEPLPFNQKMIDRRIADGAELWPGPVMFHDSRAFSEGEYPLGVTTYFSVLTVTDALIQDLQSRGQHPLAMRQLVDFETALTTAGPMPLGVGADVACVFDTPSGPVVPIHTRSETVVNAPGMLTLNPAFTMEPNVSDGNRSRFGLLYYNFAREFLEEFWGKKTLSEANMQPRSQPDWLLRNKMGKRLVAEIEGGRVTLYRCGVAIDLTHPIVHFALVAHFTSSTFLDYVREAPGCEREMTRVAGQPAIRFVGLHDPELTENMTIDRTKVTSLFALDRARVLFKPPQAETA